MAQPEALMRGKSSDEAKGELQKSGMNEEQIKKILPHKVSAFLQFLSYDDFLVKCYFYRFSKETDRRIVLSFKKLHRSLWAH